MSETQIILIVAAVAVIAFFLWRSLREERSVRKKKPLKVVSVKDPLLDAPEEERTEPSFDPSAEEEEAEAQVKKASTALMGATVAPGVSRMSVLKITSTTM